MATYNKAAMQYQRNAIQTASPAKLTLMLYDGAIKFANMAIEAIDKGDIEKANNNINKVQKIIVQYTSKLDLKYPLYKDYEVVYDYNYTRLEDANVNKDKAVLEDALHHIKTMRETWKEVMRINNVV